MKEYLQKLVNAGLTENEAKVYCCLLRKKLFTATEISRCASVNRSRIYTVLGSLIQKGLCVEKLGKVRKFEAVNPEIAFDKLIEKQNKKINELKQLSNSLSPIYLSQVQNSSPLDFIEVYKTAPCIIKKYHSLEQASKKCVLSFCKPPYAMNKDDMKIRNSQQQCMDIGVTFKSIYEVEVNNKKKFAKQMQIFSDGGEYVKVAYHLPIKLHIFDSNTVMFSMINNLAGEKDQLTYMVVEHKDLTETLVTTFYTYWENAMTISEFIKKENI
ncbi:MAG: helix-turn-helix domain-containing protein [Candidatus Cloacimonadota bacterium]|nr:helix-turn-helix domain-containing protein [Candidatus Cloacimonadota bacterium]